MAPTLGGRASTRLRPRSRCGGATAWPGHRGPGHRPQRAPQASPLRASRRSAPSRAADAPQGLASAIASRAAAAIYPVAVSRRWRAGEGRRERRL